MKSNIIRIVVALALGAASLSTAVAQQAAAAAASASQASASDFTEGEVRKVDKDQKKVTIKHGEIKNLDMPPMTMVFAVKDVAVLEKVKVGDKVQFKAIDDGGRLTVTELQAAKNLLTLP